MLLLDNTLCMTKNLHNYFILMGLLDPLNPLVMFALIIAMVGYEKLTVEIFGAAVGNLVNLKVYGTEHFIEKRTL